MPLNSFREHEETRRLLIRAAASARANESLAATRMLERILNLPASLEQKADAYYWLSEVTANPHDKRDFLEKSLACSPVHHRARRELAILDGKLDESTIVDPDNVILESTDTPLKSSGQRFVCPTCGGRMTYSPDGSSLACEYCSSRKKDFDNHVEEHDFVIGIAQSAGHRKPRATQSFECAACGSVFLLAPQTLSITCPHCSSAYSITKAETRELIPPEGIFPFTFDQNNLKTIIKAWFQQNEFSEKVHIGEMQAIYLPVWSFDIGGKLKWSGATTDNHNNPITVTGQRHVFFDDIFVPGSGQLPYGFEDIINRLPKNELKPYSPSYLANWVAETYSIPMADAAIEARSRAYKQGKLKIKHKEKMRHLRRISFVSTGLRVEAYKLILVPVWIGSYTIDGEDNFALVISGYTGEVFVHNPPNTLQLITRWLFGEE